MGDLVKQVRVRVEYTQTVQASQALSESDFNDVLNDAKDEIMECIGHLSQHLTAGSATEALALIMGSPFNADQRRQIVQAMTSTASRTSTRPTGRANLQSCLYFHRYCPRTLWDLMGDNQVAMDKVIQEVGDLLGALGFVNLNEQSFVHVVAMLTLARHGKHNFRVQVSG